MASRKKQSEGIALLSMYNDDEDDDEEMEDANEPPQQLQNDNIEQLNDAGRDSLANDQRVVDEKNQNEENSLTPPVPSQLDGHISLHLLTMQQEQWVAEVEVKRKRGSGRGRLAIVDYAHDEVAVSPEPEEGEYDKEIEAADAGSILEKSTPGTLRVLTPGVQATPQSSERLEVSRADEMSDAIIELEAVEIEGGSEVHGENVDPLDKFLPPPPKERCPEELQKKIDKFLGLKKIGRSFNAEVRNRKDYRNPDFLLHAVRYQDIDQIGSCFSKDVFDPHGYDQSDYYLEIEADMRRERERREQELKKSPKVEFVSGGAQPATVAPPPKFNMPMPVVAGSGLHSASTAPDAVSRDGRQNKKSKWDKVDGDGRNPLPPVGQDSLSAAHAALLSAANSGYTAFAQQKRREAEEKRPSERKLDRRS